jgi:F-type H+-transporting ATPase subunit b
MWIAALCATVGILLPEASFAAEGGIINLDKSLLIQAINFLLLLVLLYKFFYRPFVGKLDERSAAIKKSLEEAQAARVEAQRQQEEHRAQIGAAHAHAQAIRETALREAAGEQQRLIELARQEATRIVEAARTEIAQDVRRAKQELQREVGELAVSVAERLIRKSLRDEDHKRIVQEAIGQIERVR